MSKRNAKPALTITYQIFVLLIATILLAQAMTIVAIMVMPVIEPPRYSTEDIVAALRGERGGEETGRPLQWRHVDTLPDVFINDEGAGNTNTMKRIADLLDTSVDDLRFQALEAPWLTLLTSGKKPPIGRPGNRPAGAGTPQGGPPPGRDSGGPPPLPHASDDGSPPGDNDDGPPPPDPGGRGPAGEQLPRQRGPTATAGGGYQGEFTMAWRQPDGSWFVIDQPPELEGLRRIALWVAGGLLVVGPIGFWFARRISKPVREFAKAADTLGKDPEAPPMTIAGPAEIGVAADAFNDMQQRLQRYVRDRVGMVAAISHDLRTPLTRMRFKLEDADPKVKGAVLADIEKMEQMVGAVLAFLRDAAATARRERIDLASLVAVVADEAAVKGADVEAAIDEPLLVDADPIAIERLLTNLVDNAVKYGGRAQISIKKDGRDAIVTVADEGPGLPADEIEKVFAPFYRSGRVRADSNGIGLGLSIARTIARAHGGDVILRNTERGLRAELILPIAEQRGIIATA